MQQSLGLVTASSEISQFGALSGIQSVARKTLAKRRAQPDTGCVDGEDINEQQTGSNTYSLTVNSYYDSLCTELWVAGQFTLTQTSNTAGTLSGSYTYYTLQNAVYGYATLAATISGVNTGSGYFDLQLNTALSQSASPFLNLGVGCSVATSSESCSVALDSHVAALGADNAVSESVSASVSTSGSNTVLSVSGSAAAYTGGLNSTSISQQGTSTWVVNGGSQLNSVVLSGNVTVAPSGLITAASLTVTDSADGGTVNVTYNASTQTFAGAVVQTSTGATVATFTVNQNGSGSVTYSNGTTAIISNGAIVSGQTPTPTPTSSASVSAFTCPTSDGTSSIVRAAPSVAEATRFREHPVAMSSSTNRIAVVYDRTAFARQTSSFTRNEVASGGALAQSFDYPNLGKVVRVLSVAPSKISAAVAALRTQSGVLSVAPTQRRYRLTSSPLLVDNHYFGGFSPANVAPYYESATLPGQWDMHAIGMEYAYGYSQNTNSTGSAHANALGTHSVKIAIIDTGQDTLHPDLAGNVVYQKCFITNEAGTSQSSSSFSTDPQGHGTDVSGIAAAVTNPSSIPVTTNGFAGAGGNSGLMAYRVFPTPDDSCASDSSNDPQCGADTTDIASAIDDAVSNGASVISMSLGGGGCTNGVDTDPTEGAAVANAISHNVIVVAASGNESASALDAPGCDTGVIAAGATSLDDGTPNGTSGTGGNAHPAGTSNAPVEYVASYSNAGSTNTYQSANSWGIVAPGGDPADSEVTGTADDLHWIENIWTSTPYMSSSTDSTFEGECTDDYPNSTGTNSPVDCRTLIAGTSMATPHVAGVAALICGLNPADCTPTAMKTLLCSTADNLNDPRQGCGRLNAYRAVATALNDPSPP